MADGIIAAILRRLGQLLPTRVTTAAVVGLVAMFAGACSQSEGGEAVAPPSSTGSAASSSSESTSAQGSDRTLAEIDPCSVMKPQELSAYGSFPAGTRENVGTSRDCKFTKDTDSPSTDPGRVISIGLRDQQGLKDVIDQGMGIDHVEVDGRKYAQVPNAGGCQVMIGVSKTSRVDITVNATEGTQKSCKIADEVGQIVEPRLPQN